mgnify:CR=1 FL=1
MSVQLGQFLTHVHDVNETRFIDYINMLARECFVNEHKDSFSMEGVEKHAKGVRNMQHTFALGSFDIFLPPLVSSEYCDCHV